MPRSFKKAMQSTDEHATVGTVKMAPMLERMRLGL